MINNQIIKVNKNKYISLLLILSVFLGGCYYDVEEEIYGTIDCQSTDMSYLNDILPIIESNCYECHDAANNNGGITLEGYDALKARVDSGQLLGAIKRESGFSAMPQNRAKLVDCTIEKIENWIQEGALNN
jgi:hypothetical protein